MKQLESIKGFEKVSLRDMSKIMGGVDSGTTQPTTHDTATRTYDWTPSDTVTDYGSKSDFSEEV